MVHHVWLGYWRFWAVWEVPPCSDGVHLFWGLFGSGITTAMIQIQLIIFISPEREVYRQQNPVKFSPIINTVSWRHLMRSRLQCYIDNFGSWIDLIIDLKNIFILQGSKFNANFEEGKNIDTRSQQIIYGDYHYSMKQLLSNWKRKFKW